MARDRTSRFETAEVELHAPSEDERVPPVERLKRQLERSTQHAFPSSSVTREERLRRQAIRDDVYGLSPDEEVRNDAVAAVEQTSSDGWRARWVLAEQDGSLVARSVHLEPTGRGTPAGGITTNLLRELSPAKASSAVGNLDELDEQDDLSAMFVRFARTDVTEIGPPDTPGRRQGRPRLGDDHLEAVARAYVEELKRGRGVLRRLGARFDRTPETMRDHVSIARREGFLGPAPQTGRRGGVLGPRLTTQFDETAGDHDE